MGSRGYNDNPFAEPEDVENPFAVRGTDQVNPFSQPIYAQEMDSDIRRPVEGKLDIRKKEKELDAREARLNKWENDLKKREEALAKVTPHLETRNFPPFLPIMHHDIAGDIPVYLQFRAKLALASWIGILTALLWNVIAFTAAWVILDKGASQNDTSLFGTWILLVLYVLAGWFGSYFLWYRPLYRALRREHTGRYLWFFLLFLVHIGFCIYAAIAPSIYWKINALTGIMSTMQLNNDGYPEAAIFYLVGTICYILEILLSVYLLNSIYMYFRGIGKAADMRRTASIRLAI